MASATTRHPFTLFNLHSTQPQTLIKTSTFFKPRRRPIIISTASIKSTDVSNEDKSAVPISEEAPKDGPSIDKRRLEEKFAVINTGIYECRSCGYKYDQGMGDPLYPIPPGLSFERLPDDWRCPTCGASQSFFESKRMEIAGFAQNQQFGLGGNALTSGQKAVLIYGGVSLTATYTLTSKITLRLDMEAVPENKPTVINLAQHTFWNLAGHNSSNILDHTIQIYANHRTHQHTTPTGEIMPVKSTPFDFTAENKIGSRIHEIGMGYDHNYVF